MSPTRSESNPPLRILAATGQHAGNCCARGRTYGDSVMTIITSFLVSFGTVVLRRRRPALFAGNGLY